MGCGSFGVGGRDDTRMTETMALMLDTLGIDLSGWSLLIYCVVFVVVVVLVALCG